MAPQSLAPIGGGTHMLWYLHEEGCTMWLLIWLGIWAIYMVAAVLVCCAAWRESKVEAEKEAEADDTQSNNNYEDVREKPPWFWY
jgi:hypothetical protein